MASRVFILTAGVEPTTRCLEGSCSIQLSYASKLGPNIEKCAPLRQWATEP